MHTQPLAMAHSISAPPDANGPSTLRSYREPEGTGLLRVTPLATRGYMQPHALQQHIHTRSATQRLLLATGQNCASEGRVWRAQAVREWHIVEQPR